MYKCIYFWRGGGQEVTAALLQSKINLIWIFRNTMVVSISMCRSRLFWPHRVFFFFCTWTQLGVWCAHCFIRTRSRRFGRRGGAARTTGACLELLMGLWAAPRFALRERLIVISGQHLAGSGRREEDDAGRGGHMEENVTVHCHMFRSAQVEFITTKKLSIITKTKENSFLLNWR